ncbi:hypothetical protein J7T55_014362 [Diaporthe amygdali]|uniref:uncharacterized protein n=1 Tax=Phomopsis amygdali TaxID=1214568 RepID=UPI0022FEDEDF|nr:uncharacterized protein J7T55_014362 [Diaporthe amygdali]KAJ0117912.1 hypothetical protein J7T55_014362 [Diaporthe amygdali]
MFTTMQFPIAKLYLLSALASSSQAWKLTFQGTNANNILKLNGHDDVKCKTLPNGERFTVRGIDFDKDDGVLLPDARSFKVYSGPDCSSGSVHTYSTSGDGYHPLATPFVIKSYHVDVPL